MAFFGLFGDLYAFGKISLASTSIGIKIKQDNNFPLVQVHMVHETVPQ